MKNDIVDHCAQIDAPINSWIASLILEALREGKGLPPAPPASAPLPTIEDVLRSYVAGEKLLMPCGRPAPCGSDKTETFGGVRYCLECGIRVE